MSREKGVFVSKQLLRTGTAIGANVEEAIGGQSEKDFFAKLTISYKEARDETHYWLKLLKVADYLSESESLDLLSEAEELMKIFGISRKQFVNLNTYE